MNGNEHIAIEDLAMFALLLVSEEDAAGMRGHLRECAQCREELKRVREDLAIYALAVEPLEIPAGSRERFVTRLGEEVPGTASAAEPSVTTAVTVPTFGVSPREAQRSSAGPVAVSETSKGRRITKTTWAAWAGWAAAAAAVVVAVGLKQDRDALASALGTEIQQAARLQAQADSVRHMVGTLTDPSSVRVNLTVPKAPATPSARATYEQKSGTLLMLASNLAPLQSQKVYELWLIPADGSKPVAAGTFSPDAHGNASLLVPALKGAVAAKAFGITAEPAGGSVTPTMPILLAGAPA